MPTAHQDKIDQALHLLRAGRMPEAETLYQQVLAGDPANFDALHFLGFIRLRQGRYAEALELIGKALSLKPEGKVLSNYGSALQKLGRLDEALAIYDKAMAANPDDATMLYNRGVTLFELNRCEEALASYAAVLAIAPGDAEALLNHGITLTELKQHEEAVASFDRALAVHPEFREAWQCRGMALQALKRFDEAVQSFDRALAVDPDFLDALYHRGFIEWFERKNLEAALRDFEKAARIDPGHAYVRGDLLHLRMYGADWRGFDHEVAILHAEVRAGKRAVNPFAYQAISESPADLQVCAVTYASHRFPAMPALRPASPRRREKIRLGYVSGEFRDQATAHLMAGLYECHDKDRFEIVAFDNGWADGSIVRQRLEAAFDKFIDISKLSDRAAARKIADEEIDILVNLNGYFGLARMGVFAQKPAPIQVNYLGFPGTLGAHYMDYILADRTVIPETEQRFYTEKVVYLPDSYQANDSKRRIADRAPSRAAAGLGDRAFVFCSFNSSYKLTPAIFSAWMNILGQVPGSVLWLLENNDRCTGNLRREAQAQGVAGERLIFAPAITVDDHLARLKLADLFLDTLPYNAHTTASDALWAGLPLITCRGTAFPGRVAASLLNAIGMPELIAGSIEDYQALALRLAREPGVLQSVRQKLARNRLTAPLFDTDRFCRHIETAYARMAELWRNGEPPRGFDVS